MCHLLFQIGEDLLLRRLYFDSEIILLLAAVYGKHAVARHSAERLLVFKVHLIDVPSLLFARGLSALLLSVFVVLLLHLLGRHDRTAFPCLLADISAEARLVGDLLGNDIHRAGRGSFCVRHFLVRIYVLLRFLQHIAAFLHGQNIIRQALQAPLLRNAGAGPSLGTVGKVEILHFHKGLRLFDALSELRRELSLLIDALHDLFLPLLQRAQIGQRFAEVAQLFVRQRSGRFFSVSGDEGDRIALVDQLYSRLHLPCLYAQVPGDLFIDLHMNVAPLYVMTSTIITHLRSSAIGISRVGILLIHVKNLPFTAYSFHVH